jgi:formiminotetrahydrofolate cyclodeaminase
MPLAHLAVDQLITAVAARTAAPGGGASAAVAAALGCAAGAMAARYTSGTRYAAVEAEAQAFAEVLGAAARDCLRLGDADAEAFAAVGAARKAGDPAGVAAAEARAAAVPADLLAACALHAAGLAGFLGTCNPNLTSDVKVGIHLLAGAGRAAWQTLLVNHPDPGLRQVADAHRRALARAEAVLDEGDG